MARPIVGVYTYVQGERGGETPLRGRARAGLTLARAGIRGSGGVRARVRGSPGCGREAVTEMDHGGGGARGVGEVGVFEYAGGRASAVHNPLGDRRCGVVWFGKPLGPGYEAGRGEMGASAGGYERARRRTVMWLRARAYGVWQGDAGSALYSRIAWVLCSPELA